MHTNTIGPIIIAQKLLNICSASPPSKVIFISSDSGSTALFRDHEDGFGAYAASKAALNQMLRHMAAELKRKGGKYENTCVLAMHPGEVQVSVFVPAFEASGTRSDLSDFHR
jgi:NAD(P)-dependent dehydrogenase (short-subunit alcohol dehydrogenase family)